MREFVALDDLAPVDHAQSEYADGDPASGDLVRLGAVDADDACAVGDQTLKSDLDVLECALEFSNVRHESSEIQSVPVGLLRVLGIEVASDRPFVERLGGEHVSKRPFDQ